MEVANQGITRRTRIRTFLIVAVLWFIGILVAFLLFGTPYFATRPLSRKSLIHSTPRR
jgi:hypothetical protein